MNRFRSKFSAVSLRIHAEFKRASNLIFFYVSQKWLEEISTLCKM